MARSAIMIPFVNNLPLVDHILNLIHERQRSFPTGRVSILGKDTTFLGARRDRRNVQFDRGQGPPNISSL